MKYNDSKNITLKKRIVKTKEIKRKNIIRYVSKIVNMHKKTTKKSVII